MLAVSAPFIWWVGQANPNPSADWWASLSSIGIGSLVSIPLIVMLRIVLTRLAKLEKQLDDRNTEKVELLKAQLEREREVSNTVVPMLERVGALLHDTPEVIDRAFASAQGQQQRADNDIRLRQMEMVVDGIIQKLSKPNDIHD